MGPSKEFSILVKIIGGIAIFVGIVAFISRSIIDVIYFVILLCHLGIIICSEKNIIEE
jgi:hypothetical protein